MAAFRREPDLSLRRAFFRALPQLALSRLGGWAARRRGGVLTTAFVAWFTRRYGVDLAEAEVPDARAYRSFAAFFTRALRPGARTWPADARVPASPVDGVVSAAGGIRAETLVQAKGIDYRVADLIGADAGRFEGGAFATLYLRPRDYHRIHAPLGGELVSIRYCRGRLWPVRPWAVREVPGLFCRNERLALDFDTSAGRCCLVMVGALMVGGLETVVTGPVARRRGEPVRWNLEAAPRHCERGDEIGRFNFGSTVVVLFEPGRVELDERALVPEREIRLGAALGRIRS